MDYKFEPRLGNLGALASSCLKIKNEIRAGDVVPCEDLGFDPGSEKGEEKRKEEKTKSK